MSIISRLSVVLGLDTGQFNAGLGKAEGDLNKFSGVAKGIGVGAVAALGAAFLATAKDALEFADQMDELATANDMTIASTLELSQALAVSGGKLENTSKLLVSFTNKIDEAAQGSQKTRDKFKELGISLDDLRRLSKEDLLEKTVKALAEMPDSTRKSALAFDLFGKSVARVDLKAFAQSLEDVKGQYDKSEESFKKIAAYGDMIAIAWFKAKVNIANAIVGFAEAANKELERSLFGAKNYRTQLEAIMAGDFSFKPGQKDVLPKLTAQPEMPKAEVKDAAREVKAVSDEQQKVLDKIESQRNALRQNILTIERQTKEIGTQKMLQNEILQQFEKGGRYDEIKDAKLKQSLIDKATEYEIAKRINDVEEARGRAILAFIEQGKELQRQAIERKRQQAEAVDLEIKSIETSIRRNEYEKQLAGFSDITREKALAYFDLKEKIIALGADPMWSQAQIDKITKVNQELIVAEEANKRAQNTFQAGWAKAYNTFKEKANDSFAMGQQAFQSMTSNMESALDRFVSTGKLSFKELAASIIQDLIRIQLKAQATKLFSGLFGGLFGGIFGSSGGGNASPGIPLSAFNIPGFAEGGMPDINKPSIVGERGPELFIPRTAGTIIPNNQLSSAMGNQPQVVYNGPYIENMSAIDTQSAAQFLAKNKDSVWASYQSAQRSLPMSRA